MLRRMNVWRSLRGLPRDLWVVSAATLINRLGMMGGIDIGQRQTVIEKRHLDFAVLQRARDALVVFRRQEIEHRRRMPPRAGQIGAVLSLQKGDQCHHPVLQSHGNSLQSICVEGDG